MDTEEPKIVMIIDDHDDGRESLAMLLKTYGFVPFQAKNSVTALEYLEKGLKPCVVLLDLIMPGDGWHFRSAQMSHPDWREIPVLISTGMNKRPEYISEEVEIPPEHCLLKPLDANQLIPMLGRFCQIS